MGEEMRARGIGRHALYRALTAPGLTWYVLFLIVPMLVLVIVSLGNKGENGGYEAALTLANYSKLDSRLAALINTLTLGLGGMLASLLVAYPMAYFISTRGGRYKFVWLALVMLPFLSSFLIRTYAWVFLLGNQGLPQIVELMGFGRVRLLNTSFAVLVGIVYNYLPLMMMPLVVALERVDPSLRQASKDLGAGPWKTLMSVTIPLSLPGIVAGVLLVFVPVLGEYLIPTLLGGGQTYFLGNALYDLFFQSRDWPFGASVAVSFIILVMLLVSLYAWFVRRIGPREQGAPLL